MGKKTAVLMVLLLVMAGVCYATSAPLAIAPGASLSLYGFIGSIFGTSMALADPVPGGPGGGGD